ncbi:MAG: hypothetical protein LC104_05800 [Bacteroidales bacterium]|nr:hypothetical protein [Bacteroidales bacterium]
MAVTHPWTWSSAAPKDREKSVQSSEAFVKLAMIHYMLNRPKPKHADPQFQYHTVA